MLGQPNNMWQISPQNLALIPSDIQPTGGPGAIPGYPKLVTQYHLQEALGVSATKNFGGTNESAYFHLSSNSINFSSSNPFGVKYESADYIFSDREDYNDVTLRQVVLPAGHLFHASLNMQWGYVDPMEAVVTSSALFFSMAHQFFDEGDEEYIDISVFSADRNPLGEADIPFIDLSVKNANISAMFYSPESDLVTEFYPHNEIQIVASEPLTTAEVKIYGYNYTLLDLGAVGIISGAGFG